MNYDYSYTTTTASPEISSGALAVFGIGMLVFMLITIAIVAIPAFIVWWKLFTKAGKPGWAAIVPIYNLYIMTEIGKAQMMYFVLALIPGINIIGVILILVEVAKQYDKPGTVWVAAFFPIIALFMVKDTNYIGGGLAPQQSVPPAGTAPSAPQQQ